MDFEFSAEQEALRQTTRRFLEARAPLRPYVRDQLSGPGGTAADVWQGLAELGATGLLAPAAYGGAGLTMVDMGVVLEEMGRLVHPGPFLASAVGAISAVLAVGDDATRADWLPALAGGQRIGTLALFEPGAGGGWRHPDTVAAGDSAGRWALTGTKSFVPDAEQADLFLVTARTEQGLGLFAVDQDAAGVGVDPFPTVDGTRKVGTLTLAGAPARPVGQPGLRTVSGVALTVDRVVSGMVVDGVGTAQAALDVAVAYAKERIQFDRPIGAFQAVQHLCAEMLQYLELGRAGAYYALWAADRADPAERHRAATMAKAYAGNAFFRIGAGAIQVLGGIGFTWDHDAHLYYKRLMSLQDSFGATAEHLEELASLVL